MVDDATPPPGSRPGVPAPNAAVLLIAVGRRVGERLDAQLARHELAYRHLSALGHLAHDPELSYSELGRRVGVTAQSMQATLAELERRRAVERITPPGRGRTARLRVTAEGDALRRAALTAVAQVEHELLAELDEPRRNELTTTLLQLLAASARPDAGPTTTPPRPARGGRARS